MGKAEIIELKEMTPDDIRTLIHRYYAHIRGGEPDPQQVEAIVQFARGLPMVATTVVQLWVKYGLEDFQTVRPQVVSDLVDRLLEGVSADMRPAFESAAVLRYFNVEALQALLDDGNAEALYAELRRWPFIRPRKEGLAVHDAMREMINEALKERTPERFRTLHERAANYYEARKATGDVAERYASERLYHRVRSDEVSGILLFQELAEELSRYHLVNRLRTLLNDVNTYPLERVASSLWREYYNAHLVYLQGERSYAQEIYQSIGENEQAEAKLRAYALCDWGRMLRRKDLLPDMEEKAIDLLEASLGLGVAVDVKLARSWLYLSYVYADKADWDKALLYLEQARSFFSNRNDYLGVLDVLGYERLVYWQQGNLQKTFNAEQEMWKAFTAAGEPAYLRNKISPTWEWAWSGRYAESEQEMRRVLEIAKSSQDQENLVRRNRELALYLGLQGKCSEALATAAESLSLARSLGTGSEYEIFAALTMYGIVCLKCGALDKAEEYLTQATVQAQKLSVNYEPTLFNLAITYEALERSDQAKQCYELLLKNARPLGRNLFVAGALTGLTRIKYAQNSYATIPPTWSQAEQIAQQYEYNDYLASLYLTRGHITRDGHIPEWESNFDSALHYYQLAIIHALRFNRFLLDELLAGREQGTPLQPIIQHCLKRGKEGQQMLVALRDWWQSWINEIGTPRPDTISLIPEGIPLLEAERLARQREPGDGSSQQSVVERITMALQ